MVYYKENNVDGSQPVHTKMRDTKKPVDEIIKKWIAITLCVISVIITLFFCFLMYKKDFNIESVLSVLLAFFSIFISIIFYFKAAETSTKFYHSSYTFMKDQSTVLVRIEERFGEKFNTLAKQIDHITPKEKEKETKKEVIYDNMQEDTATMIEELSKKNESTQAGFNEYKKELANNNNKHESFRKTMNTMIKELSEKNELTQEELEKYKNELENNNNKQASIQEKMATMIEELSKKNELTQEELEKYKKAFAQQDHEYRKTRKELEDLQMERNRNAHRSSSNYYSENRNIDQIEKFVSRLTSSDVKYLLEKKNVTQNNKLFRYARMFDICDDSGYINDEILETLLQLIGF